MDADFLLPWLDIETTGLDPRKGDILELGLMITVGPDLEVVDIFQRLVYPSNIDLETDWSSLPQNIRDMHEQNGLHGDLLLIKQSRKHSQCTPGIVETAAIRFLESNGIEKGQLPLCGNSVGFDRNWLEYHMPRLNAFFHYRIIDVSSLKESCRRFNPPVFQKMEETARANVTGQHRVIADLRDSLDEMQFYVDNFLFLGEGL